MKRARPYSQTLKRILHDPHMAIGYLNTALAEGDFDAFLVALRDVAEVHGGIGRLAQHSRLNRGNLYKIFSEGGNPEIKSLGRILKTLRLHFSVVRDDPRRLHPAA